MNDKQKARVELVDEEIAFILSDGYCISVVNSPDVMVVCEGDCIPCRLQAIKEAKDSAGNYLVEIPDPDQTVDNSIGGCLPPTGQGSEEACDWWKWAQENMRCDNFKKFIPRDIKG